MASRKQGTRTGVPPWPWCPCSVMFFATLLFEARRSLRDRFRLLLAGYEVGDRTPLRPLVVELGCRRPRRHGRTARVHVERWPKSARSVPRVQFDYSSTKRTVFWQGEVASFTYETGATLSGCQRCSQRPWMRPVCVCDLGTMVMTKSLFRFCARRTKLGKDHHGHRSGLPRCGSNPVNEAHSFDKVHRFAHSSVPNNR